MSRKFFMHVFVGIMILFLSSCMHSSYYFNNADEAASSIINAWSEIPSNERYHVVIDQAVFEIQEAHDFEFLPPTNAEFVFIGTVSQAYQWERNTGRSYMLFPYGVANIFNPDDQWIVIIDLYNDGEHINSIKRWTPYVHLNPLTDYIRFMGTWNDIQNHEIVDVDLLHIGLRAHIPLNDVYHVRFFSTTNAGSWPIQCRTNWDFIPPAYINVEVSDIVEYDEQQLVLITFHFFDAYKEGMGYHIIKYPLINYYTGSDRYFYSRVIPIFTGSYVIGTFQELGGF